MHWNRITFEIITWQSCYCSSYTCVSIFNCVCVCLIGISVRWRLSLTKTVCEQINGINSIIFPRKNAHLSMFKYARCRYSCEMMTKPSRLRWFGGDRRTVLCLQIAFRWTEKATKTAQSTSIVLPLANRWQHPPSLPPPNLNPLTQS